VLTLKKLSDSLGLSFLQIYLALQEFFTSGKDTSFHNTVLPKYDWQFFIRFVCLIPILEAVINFVRQSGRKLIGLTYAFLQTWQTKG
jgi:hypothetical protein